jgi:putative Holliday junction resolvase
LSDTVLGFDFGTRKIGVASGQSITGTGTPLTTVPCRDQKPDFECIGALIGEWQPDALIVGLPLNMDGSESESSSRARRFARQLEGRFSLPAWLVDERLSTREARQEMGASYRGGADDRVDSMAAVLIIESWFREGGQRP